MKKRKIVLGIAMAAMAVFTLAGCDDANVNAIKPTIEENGGENTGGNTGGQTQTGGDNGGQNQTGGNTGGQTQTGTNHDQGDPTVIGNQDPEVINVTGTVNILNSCADFESAYVTFDAYAGADYYNAYVSSDNSTWTKLDRELTRKYNDNGKNYYRCDAVGLKAGKYSLKIVPVISNVEDISKANVVNNLDVIAHERTGFAFVNGSSSGAYNDDGTLKENANVVYITNSNVDTVQLNVKTGSKDTNITSCTGITEILLAYKKNYEKKPLDIRVLGTVSNDGKMTTDSSNFAGDLVVKGSGKEAAKRLSSGVTIEGIGDDATALGWGVRIANASNVEVRNLGFMLCDSDEGDNVGLQQDNDHVWVHNCDMFYGMPGGDKDQAKGDGALDSKLSNYVSFSYNHFFDSGKCNLLGLKEGATDTYYITYHHNWYDHSDSRHPRVRFYSAHVYNNYYDGNSKYGIGATSGSSIYAEKNYFRNCKYPMMISMQGSDVYADGTKYDAGNNGTFSGECGGIIKAYSNHIEGAKSYVPYNSATTKGYDTKLEFDCYEVASANELVPDSIKANMGEVKTKATSLKNTVNGISYGNTYNNFDTSNSMYAYSANATEDVPSIVMHFAGRIDGGDFGWTFNNEVDDSSSDVNDALMSAVKSYKTKFVSIQ